MKRLLRDYRAIWPFRYVDLASALGTDRRLGSTVTEYANDLNGDDAIPVTSNFDTAFDRFEPYS